jgi:FkbH-like protein
MISVVICRRSGEDWDIDTWLMSCRVLKRRVEEQMLQYLVEQARERGVRRLRGVFRPTAKNQIVAEHYPKLGFIADPSGSEGEQRWSLDVHGYVDVALPFERV